MQITNYVPINPALIPLPSASDSDLQDPVVIMKAKGRTATRKIAGARTKEKPYVRKASSSKLTKSAKAGLDSDNEDDDTQHAKRGRPFGTGNYSQDDISELLRLIRDIMPFGHLSWERLAGLYNEWAKHNRRPERPARSLESKFKAVCSFILL